ncbi:MAG: AIR carboxylase family protein [Actinobacteria bacterium]|nr:AIR carboxylase family protein [Actinomycetota bacterium]
MSCGDTNAGRNPSAAARPGRPGAPRRDADAQDERAGGAGLHARPAAGRAAHLAGVMAANTILPVIGVPIHGGHLGGADSLYSTVQMPSGVPVATVGLDQATNAAILAVQILACKRNDLEDKLRNFKKELAQGLKV